MQAEIPRHIQAVYEALSDGDDEQLSELFENSSQEQQVEMYSEIVAVQLTGPLFGAITRWMASGLDEDGDVPSRETISDTAAEVVKIVIGHLYTALNDEDSNFIQRIANEVLVLAGLEGEE